MENLLILLVFAVPLAFLVVAAILLARFSGLGSLQRRVRQLEREVDALRRGAPAPAAEDEPPTKLDEVLERARRRKDEAGDGWSWATGDTAAAAQADEAPRVEDACEHEAPETDVAPREEPLVSAPMPETASEPTEPEVSRLAPAPRPAPRPEAASSAPADTRDAEAEAGAGIEWERWIGVRGAAVLGGVVLALAGLFFFQYAIEHGLITPTMRVWIGLLAGVAAWGGSVPLRRRGYGVTAEALAGAGCVILYGAAWAASPRLFELWPYWLSFAVMALVTAGACVEAVRHHARIVAILGLCGGFATPLLLSTGVDRPVGLFGYLLLLNLGFLFVTRHQRMPLLGLLSLIGTTLIQGLWIVTQLDPGEAGIGLAALGVFGTLFLIGLVSHPSGDTRLTLATRAGGVLMPFAFAAYFAWRTDLGASPWPIGGLVLLLSAAAWACALREELVQVAAGTCAAAAAVLGVWLLRGPVADHAWAFTAVTALLAIVPQAALEWRRLRGEVSSAFHWSAMSGLLAYALLGLVAAGLHTGTEPLPYGLLGLFFSGLFVRHALAAASPARLGVAGVTLGLYGATLLLAYAPVDGQWPADGGWSRFAYPLALVLGLGAPLAAAALRAEAWRRAAFACAVFVTGCVFVPLLVDPAREVLTLPSVLLVGGALSAALACAARGTRSAWVLGLATLAPVLLTAYHRPADDDLLRALVTSFLLHGLVTAVALSAQRFARSPVVSALLVPGLLVSVGVWDGWFTDLAPDAQTGGAAPLLGACLAGCAAWLCGRRGDARATPTLWAAVGLGFAAVALPRQLGDDWLTVSPALAAVLWLGLWRARDAAALKWLAVSALAVSALGTFAKSFQLHEATEWALWNTRTYAWLLPAACFAAAAGVLARYELSRQRKEERAIYAPGFAVGANLAGLAAVTTLFLWLNLAVFDFYEVGESFRLKLSRFPARNVTTSVVWALFALGLLAGGVLRRLVALRWLSLLFLLGTIAKVFLFDLGELEGLYRVGSLVGLAFSLLLVSVLYQRFVLRSPRAG